MSGAQPCEDLRAAIREDLERALRREQATPEPDRNAVSRYRELLNEHVKLHVMRHSAFG